MITLPVPDPDGHGDTHKVTPDELIVANWASQTVIGQGDAYSMLKGLVKRYRHLPRHQPPGAIALVGPAGCGKSSVVTAVCSEAGLPVVKLDAASGATTHEFGRMAVQGFRLAGIAMIPDPEAIILVTNTLGAAVESMAAIGRLVCGPEPVIFADEGRRRHLNLHLCQWIIEIRALPVVLEFGEIKVESNATPVPFIEFVRFAVPFRRLTTNDLYAILSTSPSSPLRGLVEAAKLLGVGLEFCEMALLEMATAAMACYPEAGGHGLTRIIDSLEARLWASGVAANLEKP